jgi:hypothetical protein
LKEEGVEDIAKLIASVCEKQDKMVKKKKILKANEGEEVYKFKKKFIVELVKGEPLPHLWTHLLATTDALIYIIQEEDNTLANIKDITELLLDERTSSMPIVIVVNNISDAYDKPHFDELKSLVTQYNEKNEFNIEMRSLSGIKREMKMERMTEIL